MDTPERLYPHGLRHAHLHKSGADDPLEGIFEDWKLYSVCRTEIVIFFLGFGYVSVDDDGNVYVFDDSVNKSLLFSREGVLLDTLVNEFLLPSSGVNSIMGRYVLSIDTMSHFVAVHSGIRELCRLYPDDDRGDYVLRDPPLFDWHQNIPVISARGEWLCIPVVESPSGYMLIFVYKGVT